ncbi:recombinase family protein [Demequina sp. SO4-13]|uniref:recombinase family protein n=1 Tax=Demequina sp. SO4-13 TaxID=3401027 RepID=UPI003AF5781D
MTSQQQRAAIYARISSDLSQEAAGVRRQIEACRELAAQENYEIVNVYQDNDISAMNARKLRPGFEGLMAEVTRGRLDAVLVWQTSRLVRSRPDRARVIETFREASTSIVPVKGPRMDLTSAYGRLITDLMTTFDTAESEVKSERVIAAAAQRAADGRPASKLGFGWRKGADGAYEVDPGEAEVVKRIINDVRAEVPLRAICRALNAEKVPLPRSGVAWQPVTVRSLVLRASNVAQRVHHIGRPTEVFYEARWPPLVDTRAWEEACAVLKSPDRFTRVQRGAPRKWLLSYGVGVCGVCDGPLRGKAMKDGRTPARPTYQCDRRGCVSRGLLQVDESVRAAVIARLSQPDVVAGVEAALARRQDDDGAAASKLKNVEVKLEDAAVLYSNGTITALQLATISDSLVPERNRLAALMPTSAPSGLSAVLAAAGGIEAVWDVATVVERHALLEELGACVTILPTGGGRFKPATLTVEFAF